MGKYAILIYEDHSYYADATPEQWSAVVDAHDTFVKKVFELGGSLAGGEALAPTSAATSIKAGSVTSGPFVQTPMELGGIYVVEARDLDHAVEIAALCPAPGGGVEVRPVVDPTVANPF